MKLTLFDINKELCDAWEIQFSGVPNVTILNCPLTDVPFHQFLVTAGNSFGIMDGGIDLHVRHLLGFQIQDKVQWTLVKRFGGPIPIGESITVKTGHYTFPYLVYVPTMHTPGPISPGNILSATEAIFRNNQHIKSMACCGLGSLTGRVGPNIVAMMMYTAYTSYFEIPCD